MKNFIDKSKKSKEILLEVLELIWFWGGVDGGHHKQWILNEIVHKITGDKYNEFIKYYCREGDDPNTYIWDEGVAP